MSYTDLRYFTCPLPEDIDILVKRGAFREAGQRIEERLRKPGLPEILARRLRLELLIMEALEKKYTLRREEVYQLLSSRVKDFTESELEALIADQTLDRIWIEGQEWFIDNAAENAVKVHGELAERLKDEAEKEQIRRNGEQLHGMMLQMKEQGHCSLNYELRESLQLHTERVEEGEMLSVYLPLPVKDLQCTPGEIRCGIRTDMEIRTDGQSVSAGQEALKEEPVHMHIAAEDEGQRTVCFRLPYRKGVSCEAVFSYTIDAKYVYPDPACVGISVRDGAASCPGLPKEEYQLYTAELLPQLAFTPFMRELAKELMGEETNPLVIARRFYDYITTVAVYRFVPPYFTKTNIPEYFAAGLHGDCGMHALTFITLCRIAGIPARWQAGWYTKPMSIGNHDWAVFYVEGYGWLFADGSFGGAAYRAGDRERWDFYFGNLDPYRMVANRELQQEFDPPFAGLRLDPYDNQTGEVITEAGRVLSHEEFHLERVMLSAKQAD